MMLPRGLIGVRAGFVAVAVVCYFGSVLLCGLYDTLDQPTIFDALEKLLMAIGVAVVGDTVRPSGKLTTAFHPPAEE